MPTGPGQRPGRLWCPRGRGCRKPAVVTPHGLADPALFRGVPGPSGCCYLPFPPVIKACRVPFPVPLPLPWLRLSCAPSGHQDPSLQPFLTPVLSSHSWSVNKHQPVGGRRAGCDPDPALPSFLTLSPHRPQTRASWLCFQWQAASSSEL